MRVRIQDLDNTRRQRETDTSEVMTLLPTDPDRIGVMLAAESGKPCQLGRTIYVPINTFVGQCPVCGGLQARNGVLIECQRCRVAVMGGHR